MDEDELVPRQFNNHAISAQGKHLSKLRDAYDVSPVDLAHRAGITVTELLHIESGTAAMTMEIAHRLANGLGISISELWHDATMKK